MKNIISQSLGLDLVNIKVCAKVYQNISSRDRTIFTFSEFEPRQHLGQSQMTFDNLLGYILSISGERGGSVVECRTPEREVQGSKSTAAVLCPWARHFTPRKYWLIIQEAVAPSRHDRKIVDWDVKPQHKSKTNCQYQCVCKILTKYSKRFKS